jgi:hypothetical protein
MRTSAADALASFQLVNDRDLLLLLYATGRLEFRYQDSLTICATVDPCLSDAAAATPSAAGAGSRALNAALSPSGVCACVMGSRGDLHVLHMGRALVPQHIYEDLGALSAHVVDVLELAIVNCRDCWDGTHWLYGLLELHHDAGDGSCKPGVLLDRVVLKFTNNFATLDVNFRRAYRHSVEAVKSLIFRNIPSQARPIVFAGLHLCHPCHGRYVCIGAAFLCPTASMYTYMHAPKPGSLRAHPFLGLGLAHNSRGSCVVQEVNYIDSQSRIVIQYIRDTVRFALSAFGNPQPQEAGGAANPRDPSAAAALPTGTDAQRQASSALLPLPVDGVVVAALLPLAEWCDPNRGRSLGRVFVYLRR